MSKSVLGLILAVFLLFACVPHYKVTRYEHVERVFMNRPTEYSLYVREGARIRAVTLSVVRENQALLVDDVPAGDSMWAIHQYNTEGCTGDESKPDSFQIHVHSLKEIGGGAWDNGKFGRGRVQVVE